MRWRSSSGAACLAWLKKRSFSTRSSLMFEASVPSACSRRARSVPARSAPPGGRRLESGAGCPGPAGPAPATPFGRSPAGRAGGRTTRRIIRKGAGRRRSAPRAGGPALELGRGLPRGCRERRRRPGPAAAAHRGAARSGATAAVSAGDQRHRHLPPHQPRPRAAARARRRGACRRCSTPPATSSSTSTAAGARGATGASSRCSPRSPAPRPRWWSTTTPPRSPGARRAGRRARGRGVARRAGRDRRLVPHPRDPRRGRRPAGRGGDHQPHAPRRLRRGDRPADRAPAQGPPEQLPASAASSPRSLRRRSPTWRTGTACRSWSTRGAGCCARTGAAAARPSVARRAARGGLRPGLRQRRQAARRAAGRHAGRPARARRALRAPSALPRPAAGPRRARRARGGAAPAPAAGGAAARPHVARSRRAPRPARAPGRPGSAPRWSRPRPSSAAARRRRSRSPARRWRCPAATISQRRLRLGDPPVVGYLRDGRLMLDLRTVDPADDEALAGAVERRAHAARRDR